MTVKRAAEYLLMVPCVLLVACGAQSGRETADVLPVAEVARVSSLRQQTHFCVF